MTSQPPKLISDVAARVTVVVGPRADKVANNVSELDPKRASNWTNGVAQCASCGRVVCELCAQPQCTPPSLGRFSFPLAAAALLHGDPCWLMEGLMY